MANTRRVGEVGAEIDVDCGRDMNEAADTRLFVKLPSGLVRVWPADPVTIDGSPNWLRHLTREGDLVEAGEYLVLPAMTFGGWSGAAETAAKLTVKPRIA